MLLPDQYRRKRVKQSKILEAHPPALLFIRRCHLLILKHEPTAVLKKKWPDLEALRKASEPVLSMVSAGSPYQKDFKLMQHLEIRNLLTVLQWLWELVEKLSKTMLKKVPQSKMGCGDI